MPSLWQWPCTKPDQLDRRAVFTALARLLDVDHRAQHKPWSWTLVDDGDQGCALRVGLLDVALVPRLHQRCPADLAGLRLTGPVEQLTACEWSTLREGHRGRRWDITFVSPVTFRHGNQFLPWPAPSAVLGSLRRTWQAFGAAEAGPVELDMRLDPIVVFGLDGASRTERVELDAPRRRGGDGSRGAVTVGGFLGNVTYGLVGEADPAEVGALVRLAPFAGVGAYTLRGFGGVAVPAR